MLATVQTVNNLLGSHHALNQVTKLEEFETWVSETRDENIETHFNGYKILLRAVLRGFQNNVTRHLEQLNIESSEEYFHAESSIADIDSLNADSEASNLIKYLNEFDRQLYRAHNPEYISDVLASIREDIIEPFGELLTKYGRTDSGLDFDDYVSYWALENVLHIGNDASRGYPEGFQLGWIERRTTNDEFDAHFESYRVALQWLYTAICPERFDTTAMIEILNDTEEWSDLDRSYSNLQTLLQQPLTHPNTTTPAGYKIDFPQSASEIDHLLEGAPDPAVGINKTLDRIFLWSDAFNGDHVLNGSGVAGFVVLLEGLKSIRQQRGSDEPIRVRRLIHPDEPGSNYSYGIQHGGWTPEKGGTLNGWAVFVRVATDYSGFGSRQHSQIENLLERLSTEGVIDIKEFEVPEDTLQDYLDDQTIQKRYTRDEDHRFDGRSLDRIIADGEGTRTEFKEEFPNSTTDAGKEIAALANYNGGVVIFGVDDDGQVLGLEEPEKVENQISGILWEMMEPPLSADLHLITYEDEPILVVEIPDADNPVGCKFIYYFRNGTNVRKLSYPELKRRFG